jgi:hypothetical protein
MLGYVNARLAAEVLALQPKGGGEAEFVDSDVGHFLDLHCGHNNPFSREEQQQLRDLLDRALARPAIASQLANGTISPQISIV